MGPAADAPAPERARTTATTSTTTVATTATTTARPAGPARAPEIEPLLREVLGRRLRILRLARGEALSRTAGRAGISPQYLSEIERGLKEPSSEMIAAIAGALGTGLLDLTIGMARDLHAESTATRIQVGPTHATAGATLFAVAA
jgi:hypothetical protein